ncbi:MAG: hypothetical protein ACP5RX_03045 [Minisyncoccia bacterium]
MEKDYNYFVKKYGDKFYRLGYGMAAGKKGTRWMRFDPKDFNDEAFSDPDIEVGEAATRYAEGWLETEQWKYEVGDLIREIAEKEGIEEGTDSFLYGVFEPLSGAWTSGYADYILELKNKVKSKEKR